MPAAVTKGALLGDSIVSNMGTNAGSVLTAGGSTFTKLAIAGAIVTGQYATWQASSVRGNSSYDWIFLMVGINDVLAGTASATILANIDTFLNDIKTNNPNAKLYFDIMDPCKTRLDATTLTGGLDRYVLWQTVNAGYVSRGAINIVSAAMNDGADSLKSIYFQAGDNGLHPNAAGDTQSATVLRAQIDTDFPGPPPSPPPPFTPTYWQRLYRRGVI